MASPFDSFNRDTKVVHAVVYSIEDKLKQHRVQISPFELKNANPDNFPWMKVTGNPHTQTTSQQGGTIETPHTLKPGNVILVRPDNTASGRQWTLEGHPGTITDDQGSQSQITSSSNYYWNSHLQTGDTKAAKPELSSQKEQATTYPPDKTATINQPGTITHKVDNTPDVRKYTEKLIGQYPKMGQAAQKLFKQGMNITESTAAGSPITDVIRQWDKTFEAEAPRNDHPLQVLSRLRQEANDSSFRDFFNQAQNGQIQTIKSLLQSGISGGFGGGGGSSGSGGGTAQAAQVAANTANTANTSYPDIGFDGTSSDIWSLFSALGDYALQNGDQQNWETAKGQTNNQVVTLGYISNNVVFSYQANSNTVVGTWQVIS